VRQNALIIGIQQKLNLVFLLQPAENIHRLFCSTKMGYIKSRYQHDVVRVLQGDQRTFGKIIGQIQYQKVVIRTHGADQGFHMPGFYIFGGFRRGRGAQNTEPAGMLHAEAFDVFNGDGGFLLNQFRDGIFDGYIQ
jgi:hypothetical protein